MHRVWIKDDIDKKAFIASYYNSLSFCFVELEGRSFGGGALELMPSEAGNIIIPYSNNAKEIFIEIEKAFLKNKSIKDILQIADKLLLKNVYNFTDSEIYLLQNIYEKMLNKRICKKMR